jgi:Fe-S cluster assembly ATPase SufC
MANDLRLEISDFRAIGHADIILDGITVIAGENGSGKSTISKLLYHTIKVVNEYDSIIDEQLKNKLRRISSNFKDVLRDYSYVIESGETKYEELNQQFSEAIQLVTRDVDDSKLYFIKLSVEAIALISEIVEKLQDSDTRVKLMTSSIYRNRNIKNHIENINKKLKSIFPLNQQD